ncbi:hypothetical protein [Nakamurella aerolata]|uniref:Uncharacterized protein n=1 Tax=Nakamurella aerolata TaxID=1656892 RepID=A0A849A960_9ACTN|nr:hypothetical protein [Nakamurella aerolata]NNG36527.1 hypothetical protein [Nakamurella aerolata]
MSVLLAVSGCAQSVSGQAAVAGPSGSQQREQGQQPNPGQKQGGQTGDRPGGTAGAGKKDPLDPGMPAPVPSIEMPEVPKPPVPGGADTAPDTGPGGADPTMTAGGEPDDATSEADSAETDSARTDSATTAAAGTDSEATSAGAAAGSPDQGGATEKPTAAAGVPKVSGSQTLYDAGKGFKIPLDREWVKVKTVPFDGGTQHAFKYNAGGVTMSLITQTHPAVTTAKDQCMKVVSQLRADLDNVDFDSNVPDPTSPEGYDAQLCSLKYDDDKGDTYRRNLQVLHKAGSKDTFIMWVTTPLLGSDYDTDRAAQQSASDAYYLLVDSLK